jgi:DnaJ-class molecular chaperone
MQIDEARTVLNLPDTFTPQLLKSAYRKAALHSHPDTGGSNDLFQRLSTAYAILLPHSRQDSKLTASKTDDGTKLSELGKGYPLSESARECSECHGAGYLKQCIEIQGIKTCESCGGTGLKRAVCKKCEGTGKYRHPVSNKVIGECNLCKGTGIYYSASDHIQPVAVPRYIPGTRKIGQPCPNCYGIGTYHHTYKMEFVTCHKCLGIGKVKMWNAVIPRGLLVNTTL